MAISRILQACLLLALAAPALADEPTVIVVTGTRTPLDAAQAAASTTVLTREDIQQSGAVAADDALRSVPDFNTFRRSSSTVTPPAEDPEAQGVTLRGIGPGGASRALVLRDGLPVNDAFGGWLYWGELPLEDLDRIEIVRGGVSGLWGDFAEGGVIHFITRPTREHVAMLKLSGGNLGTTDDVLVVHESAGPVHVGVSGRFFHTDGYDIVNPLQRGPIDAPAGSQHHDVDARVDWDVCKDLAVYVRGTSYFQTVRGGTAQRVSTVDRDSAAAGARWKVGGGELALDGFTRQTELQQTFTQAAPDRTSETPTLFQEIPASDAGGSLSFTKKLSDRHRVTLGSDYRAIKGQSADDVLDPTGTAVAEHRLSRGQQTFLGAFAQDEYHASKKVDLVLDLRVDHFRNYRGDVIDVLAGAAAVEALQPDSTHTVVDPRLAVYYQVRPGLGLRGSVYRSFRAPTLAELYRRSSVEGLVLHENAALNPEFLQGGEIGVDLAERAPWKAHATLFTNQLLDPIGNVVTATDPVTGNDSERTRVNFGRARVRGGELSVETRLSPRVTADAAWTHVQALLVSNPADPTLQERQLTQVPENVGTLGVSYRDPKTTLRLQGRFQSKQFEDSDSHDKLGGYMVFDLAGTERFARNHEAFFAVQNLFDRPYDTDRGGGIRKLGTPFTANAGVRLYF